MTSTIVRFGGAFHPFPCAAAEFVPAQFFIRSEGARVSLSRLYVSPFERVSVSEFMSVSVYVCPCFGLCLRV